MVRFSSVSVIILSSLAAVATVEAVSYTRYAGYAPATNVADLALIDLDQLALNEQLTQLHITNALHAYQDGGHVGSYAVLKLDNTAGVPGSFPVGTTVLGTTAFNQSVVGTLMEDTTWDASEQPEIKVFYATPKSGSDTDVCQVGSLYVFHEAKRDGCFKDGGSVSLVLAGQKSSAGKQFGYLYDVRVDNYNNVTLQGFSTNAAVSMKGPSGVYYDEYKQFLDYYGDTDYGDKWVMAAANRNKTGFKTGLGNSDFSLLVSKGRLGPGEAMKKGAAYLNLWMEVVRNLNDAVAFCKAGLPGAGHSVDAAVAYYAGSFTSQENDEGILLYALAEVRAQQMKTAGHMNDKDVGDAYVNVELMREIKAMQGYVLSGATDLCAKAEESKNRIVTLMKIPLVQGVMRYAYIREKQIPTDPIEIDRVHAESATYAATVLPFINHCDSRVAKIIHQNMEVGAATKFKDVKAALERSYACLNITCEYVGGVWDHTSESYVDGASPCGIDSSINKAGASVGGVLGITVGILLAGWAFMRYRRGRKPRKSLTPMYSDSGNIAAVTEIA